jgi:hypothetical protein
LGLVGSPTLRPDGSILLDQGYDRETCLFHYQSRNLNIAEIPDNPSANQVTEALDLLNEAIIDFPFADEASLANALALLITPIVRHAINGNIPLALIDAPQSGTGKTLFSNLVSIIATGDICSFITAPKDKEEWHKKITSMLMEVSPIIIIDNVDDCLNSDALASALTNRNWGDRLLGKNEMINVIQNAIWIANGNNIQLGGDIPRRAIWIRLDPQDSRPWKRDEFRHPDLLEWATNNRGRLIRAILILARAWVTAGKPKFKDVILGSFTQWAETVGGILQYAGVSGFLGNVNKMHETLDEENKQWEAFLLILYRHFRASGVTTAEIGAWIKVSPETLAALPDILAYYMNDINKQSIGFNQKLGILLKRRNGTRFGDSQVRVIATDSDTHRKVTIWKFECGGCGTCGTSNYPEENQ